MRRKKEKQGISLIVLVITIIVMIILAGSIILTLSQNGIIGKANEAVSETNLKQVQQAAMLAWADAYAGGERDVDDLKKAVDDALEAANVDVSKYEITVTINGVTVVVKETTTPPVEEPDEDDTTPTQLVAPTVALSGNTLTITDNAENGSYTASFEIYVGEEKKATMTASSSTTFDLTTLELAAGTYSITVKAVAAEDLAITASTASEAVQYVVAEVSNVPAEWQAYVATVTEDDVPIPKGFVASPYGADETKGIPAENTKAGGLVIYELTDTEITNGATALPSTETQLTSWTTRNQFVWVPVDKDKFSTASTEFKRTDYKNSTSQVVNSSGAYNNLGTSKVYWELELDENNMPKGKTLLSDYIADSDLDYISEATIAEAQAMYASVKEYGGFYIARYEAGGDSVDSTTKFGRGNLSITMGKYPYNGVKWGTSMSNEVLEGGAVTLARGMYPDNETNATGVVSTLTYGVQWDRTLDWIKSIKGTSFSLTSSSENGNYSDTTLDSTVFNPNAQYASATYNGSTTGFFDVGTWTAATSFTTRSGDYMMTTGALSKANLCNIYDMAGNMAEWTMEGSSANYRVQRGGIFCHTGTNSPVSKRGGNNPTDVYACYGFRPSLYIKVAPATSGT